MRYRYKYNSLRHPKHSEGSSFCAKDIIALLFIALSLTWHSLALADISVHLDPPAARLGQVFHLNFTIEGSQRVGIPDFTPLQTDFTVIGTERSTAYSMLNGQTKTMVQWMVLLTAKKTGMLTIPAIQFGSQQSTPSSIQITEEKVNATQEQPSGALPEEVMLKIEVDRQALLVNEQLIYTVKLYNSQRLLDAQYVPPQVEDALMVPLGEGRRYQTTLAGQQYSVEEQQYAIFPQKSGELSIIAPEFSALVFDTVPRRITAHVKSINIPVKPIPANITGKYWLPAKQMAITETYDKSSDTLTEGSTLVRHITIQASGMPAQLLPTLSFKSQAEFNVYPEKPELQNTARQQQLIGRTDTKVTYILNQSGTVTIPALEVPWFNTDTGKEEIASLPARTITIQAVNGTQAKAPVQAKQLAPMSPAVKSSLTTPLSHERLGWWLAGGFATAWLLTLALWRFRKTHGSQADTKKAVLKALKAACMKHNAKQAEAVLLRWAVLQSAEGVLMNLYQIERWVQDPALKKELVLLSQALYSQQQTIPWQGHRLWQAIKTYKHVPAVKPKETRDLPSIHP